jgi:hypothetical protein
LSPRLARFVVRHGGQSPGAWVYRHDFETLTVPSAEQTARLALSAVDSSTKIDAISVSVQKSRIRAGRHLDALLDTELICVRAPTDPLTPEQTEPRSRPVRYTRIILYVDTVDWSLATVFRMCDVGTNLESATASTAPRKGPQSGLKARWCLNVADSTTTGLNTAGRVEW